MHKEAVVVINSKELQGQLADLQLDAQASGDPAGFQALIKADFARWHKVVEAAGLRQQK